MQYWVVQDVKAGKNNGIQAKIFELNSRHHMFLYPYVPKSTQSSEQLKEEIQKSKDSMPGYLSNPKEQSARDSGNYAEKLNTVNKNGTSKVYILPSEEKGKVLIKVGNIIYTVNK